MKENTHNICQPYNREKRIPIFCIDISYDEEIIVCGLMNGYVVLYDVATARPIKYFYSIHNTSSSVLAIKFYHNNSKSSSKCKIISSDSEGKVFKTIFDKNIFNLLNAESFPIIEKNAGNITDIKILKSFILNNSESTKNLTIVALASNIKVCIIQIEPRHSVIHVIPKPNFIKDIYVPSISWDEGFYKYNEHSAKKNHEKSIFLLISWGEYLELLTFKDIYDAEQDCFGLTKKIAGSLILDSPCIYTSFISINIVAGITSDFNIFFLYLDDFHESDETCFKNEGEKSNFHVITKIMPITNKLLKLEYKAELNHEIFLINSKKEEHCLFFLDKEDNVGVLELYSWQNYLSRILELDKKLAIFKLYQIYEFGNFDFIALIPKISKFRKKSMKDFIKTFMKNFLVYFLDEPEQRSNENNGDHNHLTKHMENINEITKIAIDFMIRIEEYDFLFNEIIKIFKDRVLLNIIFVCLEDYIENQQFK